MIDNVAGFGLIAVDKSAGRILFLDPATLEITRAIEGLPRKPHELLILDRAGKAYVPIFGDGVHGKNPHPEHFIAVVDLHAQQVTALIDISPYRGPHTARLGANGLIYCCCETSAVVVVIDPVQGRMVGAIEIPSHNVHRLATVPGRPRLITENEEDATFSLVEIAGESGRVIRQLHAPAGLNGIAAAPTRPWVVATSGAAPELFVVDRDELTLIRTLSLPGHDRNGQIARYRPDGEILAVIGDFEPVASFYDADLNHLFTAAVQDKPLDGTFTPDGRRFLVANEESGSVTVIDLVAGRTLAHIKVPQGCEVLGYFPLREAFA